MPSPAGGALGVVAVAVALAADGFGVVMGGVVGAGGGVRGALARARAAIADGSARSRMAQYVAATQRIRADG